MAGDELVTFDELEKVRLISLSLAQTWLATITNLKVSLDPYSILFCNNFVFLLSLRTLLKALKYSKALPVLSFSELLCP